MEKIVEAVVRRGNQRIAIGLVSVKQALELPQRGCYEFSHPAHEAGKTDVFVTRDMLSKLM